MNASFRYGGVAGEGGKNVSKENDQTQTPAQAQVQGM